MVNLQSCYSLMIIVRLSGAPDNRTPLKKLEKLYMDIVDQGILNA